MVSITRSQFFLFRNIDVFPAEHCNQHSSTSLKRILLINQFQVSFLRIRSKLVITFYQEEWMCSLCYSPLLRNYLRVRQFHLYMSSVLSFMISSEQIEDIFSMLTSLQVSTLALRNVYLHFSPSPCLQT